MRQQPKILNLSGNVGVERWAVGKYRLLEQARQAANAPILERNYVVDGVTVLVQTCAFSGGKIALMGRETGHILLASTDGVYTVFSVFDYLKETVTKAASLGGFSFTDTVLSPAYNDRCQLAEEAACILTNSWKASLLNNPGLLYLGGVNAYEQAYFTDTSFSGIYVRVAEQFGQITMVRQGNVLLPKMCGPYLNLFGVTSYPNDSTFWNLYKAASQFTITPNTGHMEETGVWLPSFFIVDPADYYGLKPGWYYGRYPNAKYSQDDPLESLKVSLSGVLETRLVDGLTQRGWCEMVTEVNGEAKGDIYFYLQPMTIPGNGYAYRELVAGSYATAMITIGSSLGGFVSDFSIQATTPGIKPDEVKIWNLDSWTSPEALTEPTTDAIGVLLIEGKKLRGYRYKGYLQQFIETDAYHSYAVSDNGQIVAIFDGNDAGLIVRVRVFDLYGERMVVKTEDPEYLQGGFSEISDSEVVTTLLARTACLISTREKRFAPQEIALPFAIQSSVAQDDRSQLPALATLSFVKNATSGLTIKKLVSENGIDAEFGISEDDCFQSTIIVDDPDRENATDFLVSKWNQNKTFQGVVRGRFLGDHPDMRFNGIGKGDSGWYGTITLNEDLFVYRFEDGSFGVDGVAGEIIKTTCLTDDFELDLDCIPNCGGKITVSVETSCGQVGALEVDAESEPLTVTGQDEAEGAIYGANGGHPPYQWSISCGTINPSTGEVLDVDECCGCGTVLVTDACGLTASKTVKFPVGQWVEISHEDSFPYDLNNTEGTDSDDQSCCHVNIAEIYSYCTTSWHYDGSTRIKERMQQFATCNGSGDAWCDPGKATYTPPSLPACSTGSGYAICRLAERWVEEWQCP